MRSSASAILTSASAAGCMSLAADALSPWLKLGDYVFRADLIDDYGTTVTLPARVNNEIAHAQADA